MANPQQIMDKLARNLTQRGYGSAVAESGAVVTVTKTGGGSLVVSYVPAAIQSPMGGINATVSPYLGIGIANPGVLMVKGSTGQNTISALISSVEALVLLDELAGFANDILLQAGDSTTQLAYIEGTADWLGMGS